MSLSNNFPENQGENKKKYQSFFRNDVCQLVDKMPGKVSICGSCHSTENGTTKCEENAWICIPEIEFDWPSTSWGKFKII